MCSQVEFAIILIKAMLSLGQTDSLSYRGVRKQTIMYVTMCTSVDLSFFLTVISVIVENSVLTN